MKIFKNIQSFEQHNNILNINENKEVSYNDIEKLTEEVKDFIIQKGFNLYDEDEFITKLEKVLYENIDKNIDDDEYENRRIR